MSITMVRINTTVGRDFTVRQEIEGGDPVRTLSRRIAHASAEAIESGIRAALVAQGWTPPGEAFEQLAEARHRIGTLERALDSAQARARIAEDVARNAMAERDAALLMLPDLSDFLEPCELSLWYCENQHRALPHEAWELGADKARRLRDFVTLQKAARERGDNQGGDT